MKRLTVKPHQYKHPPTHPPTHTIMHTHTHNWNWVVVLPNLIRLKSKEMTAILLVVSRHSRGTVLWAILWNFFVYMTCLIKSKLPSVCEIHNENEHFALLSINMNAHSLPECIICWAINVSYWLTDFPLLKYVRFKGHFAELFIYCG